MKPAKIKIARQEDRKQLVELFLNLLEYLDEFGHDILPLRENAEWFVDNTFLPAATRGEPVLIAWHEGEPIGALFWVIPQVEVQLRWKEAVGYGTYVDPDWRRKRVGQALWAKGIEILKEKGTDVITGVLYERNKGAMEFAKGPGVDDSAHLTRVDLRKVTTKSSS